jgi:hypothetical protein
MSDAINPGSIDFDTPVIDASDGICTLDGCC